METNDVKKQEKGNNNNEICFYYFIRKNAHFVRKYS